MKRVGWIGLRFLAAGGCLAGLLAGNLLAAPKARVWPRWQQHDPQSTRRIDHGAWTAWLQKYVDVSHPSGITRVRYTAVTPEDRQTLEKYVHTLQQVAISTYQRPQQQAYWINLYNAFTVLLVLQHGPVASIRDINLSNDFFSKGPWQARALRIEGEEVSLDDIEHRILRPIWRDNRLHYALNCASLGCPNLLAKAYTPDMMETLLDAAARAYINHPRGVRFEREQLYVSSIYIWFQEDFDGDTAGVITHLQRYAQEPLAEQLRNYRGVLKHAYDWQLNGP